MIIFVNADKNEIRRVITNLIGNAIKHSQESFEQALADIDEYEHYCDKHPEFKNNRTIVARTRIIDAYETCLSKDSFL